jgi:putative oxidoreductase
MRALRHPGFVRAAQIVLGFLFGWAALAKILDLNAFALQVHNFRLLPLALENLVAMLLPWVELVAAMAMVLGIRPRAGAWVAAVLLAVFTLGVAAAMARGLDFECGCFGKASSTRVGWWKLGENVGMVLLATVAALRPLGTAAPARGPEPAASPSV